MTSKLRLGPLPKTDVFKMTVAIPVELKTELDAYTQAYCEAWGTQADLASLIPFMLQSFVDRDRAFQRMRRIRKP